MAIVGTDPAPRCTPEEWAEFLGMVRHGMLFEVIEWLDAGKPSLRPLGKTTSAFESAILAPNLSMTQVLWKRAWQEEWEFHRALDALTCGTCSKVVLRYLLEAGCPTDGLTGMELCLTHDLDLIRLGIRRSIDILEPDGWAAAFIHVGSRPLIRLYLKQRDLIPGLRKDAVYAMCRAIKESRLRAIALLKWAGVDPLGKAPRYGDWDEPEEEWDGFPALYLSWSKKPDEILKLLKLKPTVSQWFELVRNMIPGDVEPLEAVLDMMPDPMAVMRRHPAESGKLLCDTLQTICWGWAWRNQRDERRAGFCLKLLDEGVRIRWRDSDDINRFRREFYRTEKKKLVLSVIRRAAELADPNEKEYLILLINKPKMRELTIQHDSKIMELLELMPPSNPPYLFRRSRVSDRKLPQGNSACAPNKNARAVINASPTPAAPEPITQPVEKPHEIKRPGCKILDRKQLHTEVWAEPTMHVAARHGISGSMLARICTKLLIPRPPRGYWVRSKAWRKKNRKPLPKWKGEGADYWAVNPKNVKAQRICRAK